MIDLCQDSKVLAYIHVWLVFYGLLFSSAVLYFLYLLHSGKRTLRDSARRIHFIATVPLFSYSACRTTEFLLRVTHSPVYCEPEPPARTFVFGLLLFGAGEIAMLSSGGLLLYIWTFITSSIFHRPGLLGRPDDTRRLIVGFHVVLVFALLVVAVIALLGFKAERYYIDAFVNLTLAICQGLLICAAVYYGKQIWNLQNTLFATAEGSAARRSLRTFVAVAAVFTVCLVYLAVELTFDAIYLIVRHRYPGDDLKTDTRAEDGTEYYNFTDPLVVLYLFRICESLPTATLLFALLSTRSRTMEPRRWVTQSQLQSNTSGVFYHTGATTYGSSVGRNSFNIPYRDTTTSSFSTQVQPPQAVGQNVPRAQADVHQPWDIQASSALPSRQDQDSTPLLPEPGSFQRSLSYL